MLPSAKAAFYLGLIWTAAFVICVSLSVLNVEGQETDKGNQDKNPVARDCRSTPARAGGTTSRTATA
jgi:hypothetical protein